MKRSVNVFVKARDSFVNVCVKIVGDRGDETVSAAKETLYTTSPITMRQRRRNM